MLQHRRQPRVEQVDDGVGVAAAAHRHVERLDDVLFNAPESRKINSANHVDQTAKCSFSKGLSLVGNIFLYSSFIFNPYCPQPRPRDLFYNTLLKIEEEKAMSSGGLELVTS